MSVSPFDAALHFFVSATLASCIVEPGLVIGRQARRGGSGEDGGRWGDGEESAVGAVGPVFVREGGELRAPPSPSVHQSAS